MGEPAAAGQHLHPHHAALDYRVLSGRLRDEGTILTLDPAWVALSLVEHVGAKKLRALETYFDGDLSAALKADAKTLQRVPGIGPKIAASIREVDLASITDAIPRWHEVGINVSTL